MNEIMKKLFLKYKENQFVTLPVYKFIRPQSFKETYEFLKESELWSEEKMHAWQFEQIKKIVYYANDHVPFYKKAYSAIGFEKGDLKNWSDFEFLPYVSKDDIKQNMNQFISDEASRMSYTKIYTGGSTDKPMEFLIDRYKIGRETAFFNYYWEKSGYNAENRCIILRADKVADIDKKVFYKYDRILNYKIFDTCYISDQQYIKYYDEQIRSFKAKIIQALPSSLHILAKAYEAVGIEPPQFEFIFLGSENIYEDQVDYLKRVFKAKKVMYHYGHSEQVLLALKYTESNNLGFMPQYGYMELTNFKNNCIKNKGKIGEIVGTGFSQIMPLIRYKTGDCASYCDYKSNDFMKYFRSVERIEGRMHEFVVTKDSRLVSLASITGGHIEMLSFVGDMQYEQQEKGKLIVMFTVNGDKKVMTYKHITSIKEALYNEFKNTMDIEIIQIDEIRKTNIGKKILLKQHLNLDDFRGTP